MQKHGLFGTFGRNCHQSNGIRHEMTCSRYLPKSCCAYVDSDIFVLVLGMRMFGNMLITTIRGVDNPFVEYSLSYACRNNSDSIDGGTGAPPLLAGLQPFDVATAAGALLLGFLEAAAFLLTATNVVVEFAMPDAATDAAVVVGSIVAAIVGFGGLTTLTVSGSRFRRFRAIAGREVWVYARNGE